MYQDAIQGILEFYSSFPQIRSIEFDFITSSITLVFDDDKKRFLSNGENVAVDILEFLENRFEN